MNFVALSFYKFLCGFGVWTRWAEELRNYRSVRIRKRVIQKKAGDGNHFAAIAAGGYHSLAITKSYYPGDFVSPYGVDFLDFAVLGLAWYS